MDLGPRYFDNYRSLIREYQVTGAMMIKASLQTKTAHVLDGFEIFACTITHGFGCQKISSLAELLLAEPTGKKSTKAVLSTSSALSRRFFSDGRIEDSLHAYGG